MIDENLKKSSGKNLFANKDFKTNSSLYTEDKSNLVNILRSNLSKNITAYMTYKNSNYWNSKIFSGLLKGVGCDHFIIEDIATNKSYFLLIRNLDYIEFKDKLDYFYPYNSTFLSNEKREH